MKDSLFNNLLESIKFLPTSVLKEMEANMEQEQMRKEFEQWAVAKGLDVLLDGSGEYFYEEVWNYWEAWKASRESLVVELPYESFTDYDDNGQYDSGYNWCLDDVKRAIRQHGIKWK